MGLAGGTVVKNLTANLGQVGSSGSIPGSGSSLAVGYGNPLQYSSLENPMDRGAWQANGNPLQYSSLENPMDRGAWQATAREVAESDTTEHAGT